MRICGGPLLKISRGFRIFIWTSPAVKRCRKMTILFLSLSSQASSTTLTHTLFLSLALSFSLSLALSLFSSLSLSHTHSHTPTHTHTHKLENDLTQTISRLLQFSRNETDRTEPNAIGRKKTLRQKIFGRNETFFCERTNWKSLKLD